MNNQKSTNQTALNQSALIEAMREKKKEYGFSYGEIAKRSGLPLGTVQKVLGGITKSPRLRTVEALASVLTATASDVPLSTGEHVSPAAGSLLKEAPASYGAYIHGSAAEKNTIGVYPMLPHKRPRRSYCPVRNHSHHPIAKPQVIGFFSYSYR